MSNDAVLLLGGTGFVGFTIASALRAEGVAVRALVRPSSMTEGLYRLGCELIEGSAVDPSSVRRAMQGCDRVVHAMRPRIARNAPSSQRGGQAAEAPLAAATVVRAARHAGVRRVVLLSCASVYGEAGSAPLIESSTLAMRGEREVETLVSVEREASRAAHEQGVSLVVLRLARPYGAGDRAFLPALAEELRRRWYVHPFAPTTRLSVVAVENVATSVLAALRLEGEGVRAFNVVDASPVTLGDLVSTVARSQRVEVPSVALSPIGGRALGAVLKSAFAVAGRGAPALSGAGLAAMVPGRILSTEALRTSLKHTPEDDSLVRIARACEAITAV